MYFEDVDVGLELPPLDREITLASMVAYAGATWDFHRYHYDLAYVQSMGQPAPFVDGQMLGALLAKQLMDWAGADAFLRRLSFRFRSLVYPGDRVTSRSTVVETKVEDGRHLAICALRMVNQKDAVVVNAASGVIELPVRGS